MSLRFDSIRFHAIARRRFVTRCPSARCVAVALVLVVSGCAPDAAVAPPPKVNDPSVYWALALDHHAVTMSTVAPYDTIRLTATPRTADGTPIDTLPAPTYTSLDLERAQVSADGLVRVIKGGNNIPVVATLAVGNLRHSDTAFINVTEVTTPPVLDTFSIHPVPPDSAKTAAAKLIVPRATTADGTPITGLSVYYTVSDPTTATIDRSLGLLAGVRAGQVTVIASATAYGVTKADTVTYKIGNPIAGILNITAQKNASGQTIDVFKPNEMLLGPGAMVLVVSQTSVPTDITFDDPTNVAQVDEYCHPPISTILPHMCGSGNIEAFAKDPDDQSGTSGLRARSFPVPGTYHFHSTIFGTTGTIVVSDDTLPTR